MTAAVILCKILNHRSTPPGDHQQPLHVNRASVRLSGPGNPTSNERRNVTALRLPIALRQLTTSSSKNLLQNLQSLSQTARRLPTHIPVEIIQYVENSRNPDIYTREFVELVMRYNQQQKGRADAYAQFRDILGDAMIQGIPDIREDVRKVLEASGGSVRH